VRTARRERQRYYLLVKNLRSREDAFAKREVYWISGAEEDHFSWHSSLLARNYNIIYE
jgi:hypothetical protein